MGETDGANTPFLNKLNSYLDSGLDTKLQRELEMLRDVLRGIINLFMKAEQIRSLLDDDESESAEILDSWIGSSKKTIYDVEDKLDLIMVHNNCNKKQKSRTSLLPFIGSYNKQLTAIRKLRHDMETIMKGAESIQDLKGGRDEEAETRTTTVNMDDDFHRLRKVYDHFHKLRRQVIGIDDYDRMFRVISVSGMEGIGKTFLVNRIWNDKMVKRHFDCRAWVADASFLQPEEILNRMLDGFCYGTAPYAMGTMNAGQLEQAIKSQLQGKMYLLVFDDVCDIAVWKQVEPALPHNYGSRVIVITRTADLIPTSDYFFYIDRLFLNDAYDLFCEIALPSIHGPHPLKEVARDIVKQCEGVPIMILAFANVARTRTDWKEIFHYLCRNPINHNSDGTFTLIYSSLSFQSRYVLLYCCLFPGDREIRARNMIRFCVAEGFVDDSGHSTAEESVATCLKQLIDRKLIIATSVGSSGNVEIFRVSDPLRKLALELVDKGALREFSTWKRESSNPLQNVRRLSIVRNSRNIPSKKDDVAFVRSCFVSDVENDQSSSICQLPLGGFRLLRVLNVRGTKITDNIVHQLGNLIHLHYLGLRGTNINEMPSSLSKLRSLQTLDIRETQVRILPCTFIRLEKLRHVHLVGSFMRKVVELPLGRKKLKPLEIQTLAGVRASTRLVEELGCWTRLQKLSIGNVRGDDSAKLCASINNMHCLGSLTIKTRGADKLQMGTLSIAGDWSSLHTLKIGGRIESLSHLVRCFRSISRLHLWDSMLDEDPFACLQHLTNLEVLSLSNAYNGKQMICNAGWFPKLEKLSLLRIRKLEQWRIMGATMPSLEDLFVGYCPNLKALPQNLEKLPSLQLVRVSQMPQDFTAALLDFTAALQEKSKERFRVHCVPQFVHDE